MKVNEIFFSIQGESTYVGRPCVFVRLGQCNLRCSYCDTTYAYNEWEEMSVDEVLNKVNSYGCKLVEITGGEPLLQEETYLLASKLLDSGYEVLIETNGSIDLGRLNQRVVKIMDIKCPSSGSSDHINWDNIEKLSERDEVKFVIGEYSDYEWAKKIIEAYQLDQKAKVLLSPVFGKLDPKDLAKWMLEDRIDARLQLQLHKFIWPSNRRGV